MSLFTDFTQCMCHRCSILWIKTNVVRGWTTSVIFATCSDYQQGLKGSEFAPVQSFLKSNLSMPTFEFPWVSFRPTSHYLFLVPIFEPLIHWFHPMYMVIFPLAWHISRDTEEWICPCSVISKYTAHLWVSFEFILLWYVQCTYLLSFTLPLLCTGHLAFEFYTSPLVCTGHLAFEFYTSPLVRPPAHVPFEFYSHISNFCNFAQAHRQGHRVFWICSCSVISAIKS